MTAILSSVIAHNFPIFQPILFKFVSKFMADKALSYKTYLLFGLRPLLIPGMTFIFSDDDFTTTALSEAAYLAWIHAPC